MSNNHVKERAVVLLSGGLDSTTCLAYAKSKNLDCYALSFNYGQKQISELEFAKKTAIKYGVIQHEIINLQSIISFNSTALVNKEISVPDYENSDTIPSTYVPARNTIMLSLAIGLAEVIDANYIYIGASSIDYSGYPDCRPEYFDAFTKLANLATKAGVEGKKLKIETPLLHLTKAETILLGVSLGVDYTKTVSCYRANSEGLACGTCHSCYLRKKGFEEAELVDPTRYMV
ncbi:MAG: 7-cyano-7-deazaguanine synthase QueC [Legionellales bacterium RIFCSPHIGHO2_12_FULL_35_11]|nr:MAG: 7-cyano-7-deazaguanine synthase QueC [Legionellales bacterium RIFCSPHIGHO2_12_FULL_35_11]